MPPRAPNTATGSALPAPTPRPRAKPATAGARGPAQESTYRKSKGESICLRLAALKAHFRRHYYFSDDNVIDVVLGTVAGNHFDNDPLWLYLIGPPSSGKTEILMSVFDCEETYYLSDFTPAALISGYKDPPEAKTPKAGKDAKEEAEGDTWQDEPDHAETQEEQAQDDSAEEEGVEEYSLLPQLNGKVVITKDFSVIHDKPSETRAQILAILRDVYDGYASRKVGNSHTKGFHSRFNYLAGMTPDIEKSWSLNTLGERFLMYRIEIADRREHARQALNNVRGKDPGGALAIRHELQAKVKEFMDSLDRGHMPEVDDETAERILDLAEVLATCRTYVHREKNDDMTCLPRAELASRVAKQLLRVGMSVALVRGRREVTPDEFEVMKRITLDSLPTNRRLLLEALWHGLRNEKGGYLLRPLDYFSGQVTRVSQNTVRRELDNLAELGAVRRVKEQVAQQSGKTKADGTAKEVKMVKTLYRLADDFVRFCENVGGI